MTLICGINPVIEALSAASRHFDRLLIVKGLRGKRLAEAMRRATRLGIPLRFEMRETLDRLAGGVPHQGIIAIVSEKPVMSLETLLGAAHDPALLVVLDGVEDPRNLGAILRTTEAAGADGVLLPERHSAGLSETVARASAGAIEHVRVARVGNLVQALEELKSRGIWIVGFDAAGQERWDGVDLTRPVALVLGGEGRGMRRLVREHCDHLVSIPHFGHVSSLNVSVAAGVALYEAVRQRGAVPSVVRPIPQRPHTPQVIGPDPEDDEQDELSYGPGPIQDGGEADEEASSVVPVPHLDFHEDVAWGRGPTVLKSIEFRRGRRPGGRGKPRRTRESGGRERVVVAAPAASAAPEGQERTPGGVADSADGAQRRKRRRRRGRREGTRPASESAGSGGAAQGGGRPGASVSTAESGSSPRGGEPRSEGENGPGGHGGRHRRRRRRRH